ncbi:MAG: DUF1826 domain-containing protein [Alphaproteobacteria bacterium]
MNHRSSSAGAARIEARLAAHGETAGSPAPSTCPAFHGDDARLRLTIADRGAGPQWLPRAVVHRVAAGGPDPESGEIETVPCFSVSVFHGRMGQGADPLMHRFAPIEDGAPGRFLMGLTVPR